MPLINDLRELKAELDIDPANSSEDLKLNFYLELATSWIEEYLDRPGLFFKERTEYYKGTNTQKILLKSRPVYTTPTIKVYQDEGGFYGSVTGSFDATASALTYGQDFALQIDQEDGTSRSGILIRMNDLWHRPSSRIQGLLSPFISEDFGSYKIVYSGGYTVDNLPAFARTAVTFIVGRLRVLLPTTLPLTGESYEERAVAYADPFSSTGSANTIGKDAILAIAKPFLFTLRNWRFVLVLSTMLLDALAGA